ncbi:MAG: undecaprenyl-diphosphate phosphatase [Thiotrichaceae bacterium]|nr:undecaprenyl-diphosphate phosphatase [Thiotrichaceae bacterium]
MEFFQVVILSIVQGLTEFLPVSSSAHLILTPIIFNWQDQGLAFDVAVHVGTLLAVVGYFRKELIKMTRSWFRSVITFELDADAKLAWAVLFGTIPVGLFGLAFKDYISENLREPLVIAGATLVFALFLWLADRYAKQERTEYEIRWMDVLMIGIAQALALIPGTSRSGATMTMALIMGFTRQAAARFSFLLSIPTIVLGGGLVSIELIQSETSVDWGSLLLAIVLSALSAWVCIHYFLKLLDRFGMTPFVIYRVLLGVLLLALFWK